ncbi:MAG: hypothetical protein ACK417_12420, partial [Bacteroidia bacterium]
MKKFLRNLLGILFVGMFNLSANAQLNLFTAPPLTGGNGAGTGGITFNLTANVAVLLDSIHVALYGSLNAATELEIWYSTSPINGNPQVGTNPAWQQLGVNLPTTVGNSSTTGSQVMSSVKPSVSLLIPAGSTYGFYVGVPTGSTGSPIYQTWTASGVDTFSNGFVTIATGQNIGYGGPRPGHVNHPRQFLGGVSILPATGLDARMAGLVAPTSLSLGANQVIVQVQNAAADPLASVDFGYQLDNNPPVTVPTYFFPSTLSPGQSYNYTFATPINIPTPGTYTLKVWSTNANGLGADNNPSNDTLTLSLCTGISGVFTIGGPAADYNTVQDAVTALTSCGITGPITFNINPGTYYGEYNLGNIPGGSAFGVSFNSLTGNPTDVVLLQDSAGSGRSHFVITSDSRISFNNLTFRKTQTTTAAGQGAIVFS